MRQPKIDFLNPSSQKSGSSHAAPLGISLRGRFFLIIFFLISFGLVIIVNRQNTDTGVKKESGKFSFLGSIHSLITSGDRYLSGEKDGRINILLLGIGGEGHEGSNLTDTIILASIDPKNKRVGLLSIPRDLFVPIPGYGYRRINNAYAFAEDSLKGSGGALSGAVIGDLLDLPVHYFVRVDFNGFKKLIDDLGGITIDVPRDFSDPLYPTDDLKTQVVSFNAGPQLMDGERALQYVRSRHGTNGEGSDFARSKRQQKLLLSIRDKILSKGVLGNPGKILRSWQMLAEHVSTNLEPWEMIRLAVLIRDLKSERIIRQSLLTVPDGPLVARLIDNAFVLLPESGTWDEIREIAKNIFTAPPEVKKRKIPAVEIQNGTVIPGFAASVGELLRRSGFQVVKIGNSPVRDYEKTVIYEIKGADHKSALEELRSLLDANVAVTLPAFYHGARGGELSLSGDAAARNNPVPEADFLIILGTRSLAVIN